MSDSKIKDLEIKDTNKLYYTYNDIHNLVVDLSNKILNSDFKPDYILAIGGGGYIPGRILRTFLKIPIVSVTINFYDSNNNIKNFPNVIQWIENFELENKNILIVDEIDDTRRTLKYIVSRLKKQNMKNLGVAVIHNKIKKKEIVFNDIPYFSALDIEDKWVVYPWDIEENI